jgi:hypothetical protein
MPEPTAFQYDLFLSHSSKDKAVVRELAERLKRTYPQCANRATGRLAFCGLRMR